MREAIREMLDDLPNALLTAFAVGAFVWAMIVVAGIVTDPSPRPMCKAGSIAALFTDCEVQQ